MKKDISNGTIKLPEGYVEIYEKLMMPDQEKLKTGMVMMEPIHVEGGKSTLSSNYVVPAVQGIVNENGSAIFSNFSEDMPGSSG